MLKKKKSHKKAGRNKRNKEEKGNKPKRGFLSPFRYPGGKSWFLKLVRQWLAHKHKTPKNLVEPFAGGAGISLTTANERLVHKSTFGELDQNVAAVWQTILSDDSQWLANKIINFKIGRRRVERILARKPTSKKSRAFYCLLRNRTARGGVITEGAGLIRHGEDDKGISSRWYPDRLAERIQRIYLIRDRLFFKRIDAFKLIQKHIRQKTTVFFIDPPYMEAAHRLYTHWEIDHESLFKLLSKAKGDVLMTYDDTAEIRKLTKQYGFKFRRISMKTTHHQKKRELMIAKNFNWLKK